MSNFENFQEKGVKSFENALKILIFVLVTQDFHSIVFPNLNFI